MARGRILVVDDKSNMLKLFCRLLSDRHDITTAEDGRAGLEAFRSQDFDLVVTDIRMPGMSGMQLLAEVKRLKPDVDVILMTAYGEVAQAVDAMKQGAYDYVTKPFDPDQLSLTIDRALKHKVLHDRASELQAEVEEKHSLDSIIGDSPGMSACRSLASRAVDSDATVLIVGESGTGKELFARAIHYTSRRRDFRFVPINCGGIPKDLTESEFFGHVKGAFSGADTNKRGLLEEADRGTAFLDEISELPLDVQVKLNRAIQEREVRPVGDVRDRAIDVRFVAATNADLKMAVDEARFRDDLYYRLNVFVLDIPPLRGRLEDIVPLTEHFIKKHCAREGRSVLEVEPEALALLQSHQWPGNVRELENILAVAVIMAQSDRLSADLLRSQPIARSLGLQSESAGAGPPQGTADVASLPYKQAMEVLNRQCTTHYLMSLLAKFEGNVVDAATHAGLERGSLYRLMRKCGVRVEEFQR